MESTKKPRPTQNTPPKPTAVRRPRPPRDGARRNTSRAFAHTRPLPWMPGLWKSASYTSRNQQKRRKLHTDGQTNEIMAPCTHPGMSPSLRNEFNCTYKCVLLRPSRATRLRPWLSRLSVRSPVLSTKTGRRDREITSHRGKSQVFRLIEHTH